MRPWRSDSHQPGSENHYEAGDRVRSRHRRTFGTVIDVAVVSFTHHERLTAYLIRWESGLVTADGGRTLRPVRDRRSPR